MGTQGEIASDPGRVLALPHRKPSVGDVTAKSPREVFAAAMASPPVTDADRTAHRCAWLAVAARDEAKRAATPQPPLAFPEAA